MTALDDYLAGLAGGASLVVILGVAVLLGLRHATDPDHLTAVLTLLAGDDRRRTREAATMGLAWGLGHATTLIALGLPIVLFERYLPAAVQRAAEVLVGLVIIVLALRLLVRLHRAKVHTHGHDHGAAQHAHAHVHEGGARHGHRHPVPGTRTARTAYGIGALHGVGGSAGVGVLLLAAIPGKVDALVALLLFAGATAVSMALASTLFGLALAGRGEALRTRWTPAIGVLGLIFGVVYVLGAVELVPA